MSMALQIQENSDENLELMKRTVGKDLTDAEFDLFSNICKQTELNPFIKQIYPLKIGGKLNIITGIDGLRSIAERTGNYSPGKEPSFQYTEKGDLISATAYVKKRTPDGTWHEVCATAFFNEYRPAHGGGGFWRDKPHIMISKCAEALAIRRAFPSVTANLYTRDEMEQAEVTIESTPMAQESPKMAQQPKIDSRAKDVPSKGVLENDPVSALKEHLAIDNVPTDRFDEWVQWACGLKQQPIEQFLESCLSEELLPKTKKSYAIWLSRRQPSEAVAI